MDLNSIQTVFVVPGAEATADAVEHFLTDYVNAEEKTVTVYKNRVDEKQYDYRLGDLTVNGIPLSRYKIVYPASAEDAKDSSLIAYYTAVVLADYLEQNGGLRLKVSADTAKEAEYEILIGATNRTASKASAFGIVYCLASSTPSIRRMASEWP